MRERQGVLITGVFGSGKTSVAVEMADILEKRGVPYGVLDLDWLAWGWPGSAEADAEHQMMLRNLAPVVRNYLDAGVRFFIFARNIRHASELDSLRATVQMPLRVIRLIVSWPEIERRLQSDIATGRAGRSSRGDCRSRRVAGLHPRRPEHRERRSASRGGDADSQPSRLDLTRLGLRIRNLIRGPRR
jgi:hypothetical protein